MSISSPPAGGAAARFLRLDGAALAFFGAVCYAEKRNIPINEQSIVLAGEKI